MKGKGYKISMFLIASAMCLNMLTACGNNETNQNNKAPNNQEEKDKDESAKTEASIQGIDNVSIEELSEFDPLKGVTAKGTDGSDATSDIEVKGEVDTLTPGDYELTYSLKGTDLSVKRVVTVKGVEAALANGTYNLKFASADTRHTFMAAAEDYMLHNMYGGVPLYSNAAYYLASNRMQLYVDEYLASMGFGLSISTMSADDSTVIMENGEKGKEGEYTYRISIGQNPATWHHWKYDDEGSSDVIGEFLDSLYVFDFNEDKTGFDVNPSMADGMPTPIDGKELPSGTVISNKWQIKIRDGLEWKFHPEADTSMVTDTTINAVDFYETYRIALEQKWFRAVSGGGDFCTSSQKVVNAQEFVDGTSDWEDVGIKLIDDNTIEFEFVDAQSEWDVKYAFASWVMTPIHTEMFAALGDQYGTNEKTVAINGPYYPEYYENDKVIRYKKNDKYHNPDKYFYTGKTFTIITESEMAFQEFVAGKLDFIGLPATHYEEYKNHPGLKSKPGVTTTRMMINGLGTRDAQIKQFPDSTWEPEPLLANQDFKMGVYHAIDRNKLAYEVMKTVEPQMYHFSSAYLVQPQEGIPYRDTEQGKEVASDLSPSTYGYNLDAARAYFDKALDTLVADGVYKSGDEITYELYYMTGSETQSLMAAYLKDAMEVAFNSEKHNIKVKVETVPKEFPGIYYDHMMLGEFDMGIGGISGSELDAAGFLNNYTTDNRNGFTLNWGIDTTVPEITVAYENEDGEVIKEIWSYDAITSALSGEIDVVDGKEAK